MSLRTSLLSSAAALLCGIASCSSQSPEATDVEQAFSSYRTALLEQKGDEAVNWVAPATIKMYQETRDLALNADEATVKNLPIGARMQVLLMRHRVSLKQLQEFDGKKMFAHAVDQNWIGKEGVQRAGVSDVVVDGTQATGKVTVNGKSSTEKFHFVKENGRWTVDLTPSFSTVDRLFQQAANDQGMTENDFIFAIITKLSGRPVTSAIWQPLE
jgi:hypothetical protein